MSKSRAFKAACLGASLVTAWSATKADAADFQITASGTLAISCSNAYFMVGGQLIPVPSDASGISALSPPSGSASANWAGTILLNMPDNFASEPWVMIGGGTGTLANDVIMAGLAGTLILNQNFDTVFAPYTETTIEGYIKNRASTSIAQFLSSIDPQGQMPGLESPAVMFTNGTQVGSIMLNVTPAVPEPGTLSMLALAVGGLFRRMRRGSRG
jgi:hypothetical protein